MSRQAKNTTERRFLAEIKASGAKLMRYQGAVYIESAPADLTERLPTVVEGLTEMVYPKESAEGSDAMKRLLGHRRVVLVTSDSDAKHWVPCLLADAAITGCLAVDTETMVPHELQVPVEVSLTKSGTIAARQPIDGAAGYALDPIKGKVRLVQVYSGRDNVVLFDMASVSWGAITPLFHGSHGVAFFNGVFDLSFLMADGGIEPSCRLFDVQIAMRLLDPCERWPIAMKEAAKILLDIQLPKEHGASDWSGELSAEQLDYAALDAVVTHAMWERQRREFDEQDENVCTIFDGALIAVARMRLAGVPFDKMAHQAFIETWKEELVAAEDALSVATDGFLTEAPSPQQVRAWLNRVLDSEKRDAWPKSPKTGELAANKSAFITHGEGVPGIPEIQATTQWVKGLNTYGQALAAKVDGAGFLRAQFLLAGARTGRFSSRNPNLQNLPKRSRIFKKFRDVVRAPDGYLILSADYSQIELRQVAEIAGDRRMQEAYREYGRHHRDPAARAPFDIHRVTARGLAPDFDSLSREEQDAVRSRAKGANFGLTYGAGAKTFKTYLRTVIGVDVSLEEATNIIYMFKQTYPELSRWQEEQSRSSREGGFVETIGGRRWWWSWRSRDYEDVPDDMEDYQIDAFLEGYERNLSLNLGVQGTAAEVMVVALTYIDRAIRGTGASLIGTVHDECLLMVPSDRDTVRRVRRLVIQKMTRAWLEFNPDAPWRGIVEVTLGRTWGTPLAPEELVAIYRWL